jgi:hypothetical protein
LLFAPAAVIALLLPGEEEGEDGTEECVAGIVAPEEE